MKQIVYILSGDPVALARPRFSPYAVYDTQKLLKRKAYLELLEQNKDKTFYSGPCHLEVTFYIKMAKTSVIKMKALEGKPHDHRPDLDNLIKWACEIIQMNEEEGQPGILVRDDCIIASINAKKVFDLTPRTEFTIIELK